MRALRLAALAALVGCSGGHGTFIVVTFAPGTAPAGIRSIDLQLTLDGQMTTVPIRKPDGAEIRLPDSKTLDIGRGAGAVELSAIARDLGGVELAHGSVSGTVTRGETLEVTLTFGSQLTGDGGLPDGDGDACPDPGCMPADLTLTPGRVDFGTVSAGGSSQDQVLTLANDSELATEPLLVVLSGASARSFPISSDGCTGQTLAPHATCQLALAFAPQAAGTAVASLKILDPGATVRSATAAIMGAGVTPPVLSLSPGSQRFSDLMVGASGADVTFTVANTGGQATGSLTATVSDPAFVVAADGCSGRSLTAAGSCTLAVHFRAAAAGTHDGTLTVTGAPGGTTTAALSGNGLPPAVLALGPSAHDFGSLPTGGAGASFAFTVSNSGSSPTGVLAAAALASSDDFTIVSDGCLGVTLMPGGNCTIGIGFTPGAAGPRATTLTVTGDPGGTDSAALSGTGLAPSALSAAPAAEDFGSVVVGGGGDADLVLSNPGDATTSALAVAVSGAEFSLGAGDCAGSSLAPHASCTVRVHFAPTAAGARPGGSLVVSAATGGTVTVPLTGTGLAVGTLAITPSPHDFGTVPAGQSGPAVTLTVANRGGAATGRITTALGGTGGADFRLSNDHCDGSLLAPGASCTLDLAFAPAGGGARNATLTASAGPGETGVASLTGTAVAPAALAFAPASSNFPGTPVGQSSATQDFVLRNGGGVASGALAVALTGADAGQFTISSDCPPAGLPAAATCTVTAGFAPTGAGARNASLRATTASGGATATLGGTGLSPASLVLSPPSQGFGAIVVGQPASQVFTLSNQGDLPSSAPATALTGPDPTSFALSADGCAGQTLQPGGSCTLTVTFMPAAVGARSATLSAGDASAALSGTGIAPAQLTLSPPSRDYAGVLIGATVDQAFTVTNSGAAGSGSITLGLSGETDSFAVVAGGTCASGTTTLAAGASCTVTVRFAPTTRGVHTASLTAGASNGGTTSSALTGTGQAPARLTTSVAIHDFGNQLVGTTSDTYGWTISNGGDVASGPITVSGSGPFGHPSACTTLAPGASCTVSLSFAPTSGGLAGGTVIASATPGDAVAITLIGTGTAHFTLNVTLVGSGAGTVTSVPAGINCTTGTCSAPFASGTQVVLTASAQAAASFTSFSGGGCTTSPCTLTIAGTSNVTASFAAQYALTINVVDNGVGAGSVTVTPPGTTYAAAGSYTQLYPASTYVTLGGTPVGSTLTWSGECTGSGGCGVMVDRPRTVTASFDAYPIVVSLGGNGGGTVSYSTPAQAMPCPNNCLPAYPSGTLVTLTAAPTAGNSFTGWSGACTGGATTCVLTVDAAKMVTASFVQSVLLTVSKNGTGTVSSSDGAINCGSTCSATYGMGAMVTLSETPGGGKAFGGWGGACAGLMSTCTVTLDMARTVTASFSSGTTFSVNKSGTGNGTVTSTDGRINCGATCSASYVSGSSVTLTATPDPGMSFTSWSGSCSGSGTCTTTVSSFGNSATAHFNPITTFVLTLSVSGTGGGHLRTGDGFINCTSGSCSHTYSLGTSVTVTATANSGSVGYPLSGPGCAGSSCAFTQSQPTDPIAIAADFEPPVTLTLVTTGTGSVTNSQFGISCTGTCSVVIPSGANLNLSTPVTSRWTGQCAGTVASYCQFTVSATQTVHVDLGYGTVSASTTGGQARIVSSPPGIYCDSTSNPSCRNQTAAFPFGTVVTITETPIVGSFQQWGGACTGTQNTCTVTVTSTFSPNVAAFY